MEYVIYELVPPQSGRTRAGLKTYIKIEHEVPPLADHGTDDTLLNCLDKTKITTIFAKWLVLARYMWDIPAPKPPAPYCLDMLDFICVYERMLSIQDVKDPKGFEPIPPCEGQFRCATTEFGRLCDVFKPFVGDVFKIKNSAFWWCESCGHMLNRETQTYCDICMLGELSKEDLHNIRLPPEALDSRDIDVYVAALQDPEVFRFSSYVMTSVPKPEGPRSKNLKDRVTTIPLTLDVGPHYTLQLHGVVEFNGDYNHFTISIFNEINTQIYRNCNDEIVKFANVSTIFNNSKNRIQLATEFIVWRVIREDAAALGGSSSRSAEAIITNSSMSSSIASSSGSSSSAETVVMNSTRMSTGAAASLGSSSAETVVMTPMMAQVVSITASLDSSSAETFVMTPMMVLVVAMAAATLPCNSVETYNVCGFYATRLLEEATEEFRGDASVKEMVANIQAYISIGIELLKEYKETDEADISSLSAPAPLPLTYLDIKLSFDDMFPYNANASMDLHKAITDLETDKFKGFHPCVVLSVFYQNDNKTFKKKCLEIIMRKYGVDNGNALVNVQYRYGVDDNGNALIIDRPYEQFVILQLAHAFRIFVGNETLKTPPFETKKRWCCFRWLHQLIELKRKFSTSLRNSPSSSAFVVVLEDLSMLLCNKILSTRNWFKEDFNEIELDLLMHGMDGLAPELPQRKIRSIEDFDERLRQCDLILAQSKHEKYAEMFGFDTQTYTVEDVVKKYKSLSLLFHPDKFA